MDTRIVEKIKKIEISRSAEMIAEKQQKIEQEKARKIYINKKLPEARKWVEDRLLDIIAEASVSNTSCYKAGELSELDLEYCDSQENGNRNIPVEAKAQAAREIEGLAVREEWCPESQNPNDETGRTWDDAHYSYYVGWK